MFLRFVFKGEYTQKQNRSTIHKYDLSFKVPYSNYKNTSFKKKITFTNYYLVDELDVLDAS